MRKITEAVGVRNHSPKTPIQRPLTDAQREVLPAVLAYALKLHRLPGLSGTIVDTHAYAKTWLTPQPRKRPQPGEAPVPLEYQRFAVEATLTPWSTRVQRLQGVLLCRLHKKTLTATCYIGELARQLRCSRSTVQRALRDLRTSPYPLVAVETTTKLSPAGNPWNDKVRITFVHDPLAFAAGRDQTVQAKQAERRKDVHYDQVQLQVAVQRHEIEPAVAAKQQRKLDRTIKFGTPGSRRGALPVRWRNPASDYFQWCVAHDPQPPTTDADLKDAEQEFTRLLAHASAATMNAFEAAFEQRARSMTAHTAFVTFVRAFRGRAVHAEFQRFEQRDPRPPANGDERSRAYEAFLRVYEREDLAALCEERRIDARTGRVDTIVTFEKFLRRIATEPDPADFFTDADGVPAVVRHH